MRVADIQEQMQTKGLNEWYWYKRNGVFEIPDLQICKDWKHYQSICEMIHVLFAWFGLDAHAGHVTSHKGV